MHSKGKTIYSILKIKELEANFTEDAVVEEISLSLYYNGELLVNLFCSPSQIEELALGFLLSEGIIKNREDFYSLKYVPEVQCVWIEGKDISNAFTKISSACCGKSRPSFEFADDNKLAKVIDSDIRIPIKDIYFYADYLQNHLPLFKETGGIHSGGVANNREIIFKSYDIGRHNVFDKLYGQAFQNDNDLKNHVIFFSGRVSSEILFKVAKMGIPVLIARSAPTNLALEYAKDLNITIAGFARENRVNIYTCPERIIL